ncbi:hypothetical protein NLJ89_g5328 [Agrocybe chaxingu]|uniref:Uncharacterized protein n=1 Tax=Agrocybe chaxingu TaxID=84603 RepID=A0A9W8MV40_9AGAR|nr:hypothetical protein NLJ89_g5328 [Agrocybe chaxingu]
MMKKTTKMRKHRPPGLFAGDAPQMRSFSCPSQLDIDLSASWLADIRHLSVGEEGEGKVPLSRDLKMLARMRQLESLKLSTRTFDVGQDLHSLPVAHVPNLIDLVLHFEDIVKNSIILKHIASAPGCAIQAYMLSSDCLAGDQELIKTALASHAENRFNRNVATRPESLELNISLGHVNVWQYVRAPMAGRNALGFMLRVHAIRRGYISGLIVVLAAFSSCDFTHIANLELQFNQVNYWEDPNVQVFIYILPNISVLDTNVETFEDMSSSNSPAPPPPRIPFRKLATIRFRSLVRRFISAQFL